MKEVKTGGLTQITEDILNFCHRFDACTLQLHGDILLDELINLRKIAPELFIIKSLIVKDNTLSELEVQLSDYCPYADAVITDTYDPETEA